MKRILLSLLAIVALSGCSTWSGGITSARVQSITRSAVWTTASVWTLKHPETVPKFENALHGIDLLVQNERWDLSALTAALAGSGAQAFTGDEAKILISGANLIIVTTLGDPVDLNEVGMVRAVILGSQEGLNLALGK